MTAGLPPITMLNSIFYHLFFISKPEQTLYSSDSISESAVACALIRAALLGRGQVKLTFTPL